MLMGVYTVEYFNMSTSFIIHSDQNKPPSYHGYVEGALFMLNMHALLQYKDFL